MFSALIGNGDMHLKNWSLIYPDRRSAAVSPAGPGVGHSLHQGRGYGSLNFSRTKKMAEFDTDELRHLAAKALLPEKLVIDTAAEPSSDLGRRGKPRKGIFRSPPQS
ncbi:hypothetical protein NKH32_31410 [Mesorhizobium sp. M1216]